jgi:hypothetical protein
VTTPPTYHLTLRDAGSPGEGHPAPVDVRLRRALKCLLRSFGLRCVRVEEVPAVEPDGRAKPSGVPGTGAEPTDAAAGPQSDAEW